MTRLQYNATKHFKLEHKISFYNVEIFLILLDRYIISEALYHKILLNVLENIVILKFLSWLIRIF